MPIIRHFRVHAKFSHTKTHNMKKTITLLLAVISYASAAELVDLSDKWNENNTADISNETFTGGKVTFFLTLNLDQLSLWSKEEGNIELGYVSAYNTAGDGDITKLGCIISSEASAIRPWRQKSTGDSMQGTIATLPLQPPSEPTYATLIFTAETSSNNSKANGYLFLWDENHKLIDELTSGKNITIGSTLLNGVSYTAFTINADYVNRDQVALYNGALTENQDLYEIAKSLLPSSPSSDDNIPEPATATLSLLALAGLAARRRRR